mgnify:CR=1 FL=1
MTRLVRNLLLAIALVCASAPAYAQMPDSYKHFLLARDATFLARLQVLMVTTARVVKAEALVTAQHAARSAYASRVIEDPANKAQAAAIMLAAGTNVANTITFNGANEPVTSVTDAALLSQIATYWSWLAGADTGS